MHTDALTPNHAMDSQARVSRRWPLVFLCLALLHPVELPAGAAPVQDNVPPPPQAFTPRTAVAFYADLQSASKSAIWKAIEEKAGPLVEELQSLQQGQMSSLRAAQGMAGFKQTNLVEVAIAVEGDRIFSGLRTDQLDTNVGFVVVLRLTQMPDIDNLIQQALEAIDKEKPGLRGQIEKSRRKVGPAEFFDLPSDALGEQKLPFSLSCAVGPGKDGTVFGLGRTEHLRAFLSGRTEGRLRGQANDALSRRGQVWFFMAVPKDASRNLGGGSGAGLNANPMLAGLAQSMDQVRDVNFSFNFGAAQVDFELDLNCVDAAAAGQLAQGIQGLLGMIQLSARQNPSSTPPFVGKINAAAQGATFRVATAFTMRDVDLALKNVHGGVASAGPRPAASSAKSETVAPAATQPPVDVEFVQFNSEEQESLRHAKMRVQNRSARAVKEIKLTFTYLDQSGRKLGQWTRTHSSLTSENLVGGEATQIVDCLAFNVPASTKKVAVRLCEVTFANGEKWSETP